MSRCLNCDEAIPSGEDFCSRMCQMEYEAVGPQEKSEASPRIEVTGTPIIQVAVKAQNPRMELDVVRKQLRRAERFLNIFMSISVGIGSAALIFSILWMIQHRK